MISSTYGNTTWWGFSPAQNLLEVLSKHKVDYNNKSELNILLVGAGDGRHVIKTISKLNDFNKKIHFFVIENDLETVARQLLLINLSLEPITQNGLQEKTELFMDLYGNSLIREATADYLHKKSNQFIKWVTGDEKMPSVWNLANLKFKEKDQLEDIFKFWRNLDKSIFNMEGCWTRRCQDYLGNRYDTRENVFDWNYSMQLKERASIINWLEYKRWRESGIAFVLRDKLAYKIPNKTLASGVILKSNGEHVLKQGYWGDILIGPYITFGTESEKKSLLKKHNDTHVSTASDVTQFNITSIIHGIHYQESFIEPEENFKISETVNRLENENPHKQINNFCVSFLSPLSISDICKKSNFQHKFDIISFSNSMVHLLNAPVSEMFAKDGLLMIESTKFMLDVKQELHYKYAQTITELACSARCKEIETFKPIEHAFAVFKFVGV